MNARHYRAAITRDQHALTIRLSGEIDFAASLALLPKLKEVIDRCAGDVLFDLGDITFIDSEGLKMLLTAFSEAQIRDCRPRITSCSDRVRRVTDLTGVSDLLGIGGPIQREFGGRRLRWRSLDIARIQL